MLAMPTHDIVPSMFMYDFANMKEFIGLTLVAENLATVMTDMVHGTYIHAMRQELIDDAIRNEADYMLWIDTDMRFPKDALLRLLKHNVPIVGINYSTRRIPCQFVTSLSESPDRRCWTTDESTGLKEVERIGFGLVLMRMSVVDEIGPPPWFQNVYDPDLHTWCGEDFFFCRLLRKAGIPILIDHDLSKDCGHMGMFNYKLMHAETWQIEEREKDGDHDISGAEDEDNEHAESS